MVAIHFLSDKKCTLILERQKVRNFTTMASHKWIQTNICAPSDSPRQGRHTSRRTKTIDSTLGQIWISSNSAKSHCFPFVLSYPFVIACSAYLTPQSATVWSDLSTINSKDGNLVRARNKSELHAHQTSSEASCSYHLAEKAISDSPIFLLPNFFLFFWYFHLRWSFGDVLKTTSIP